MCYAGKTESAEPISRARLIDLAKEMERKAIIASCLASAQTPNDIEKRVDAMAAYTVAQDEAFAARQAYHRAMSEYTKAQA